MVSVLPLLFGISPLKNASFLATFGMNSAFDCIMQMKLMSLSFVFGQVIFCNAFTLSGSPPMPFLLIISLQNFSLDCQKLHSLY